MNKQTFFNQKNIYWRPREQNALFSTIATKFIFESVQLSLLYVSLTMILHHTIQINQVPTSENLLTRFSAMSHFRTHWKRQKTYGFVAFWGV